MNNINDLLQLLQNDPNATKFEPSVKMTEEKMFNKQFLPFVTSFGLHVFKDKKEFKEHLKFKVNLKIFDPNTKEYLYYSIEYYCGKITKEKIQENPSLIKEWENIDKEKLNSLVIKHFVNTRTGYEFDRADIMQCIVLAQLI